MDSCLRRNDIRGGGMTYFEKKLKVIFKVIPGRGLMLNLEEKEVKLN